jgi:hypothetical protein
MSGPQTPNLDDFAEAEHFVLEDVTVQHEVLSEEYIQQRKAAADVREVVEIRDKLRRRVTSVRFFDDGWINISVVHRKKKRSYARLDLRFLDPTPTIRMYHPIRLLQAAATLGGLTAIVAIPAGFGWLAIYTLPATIVCAVATLGTLIAAGYLTHEKICFRTLHGRANAIRLGAGLGTIRQFHKLVPKLVEAIADAARFVRGEKMVYLRAEMREHYRLRSEGVLSEKECVESTSRILSSFDGKP